MAVLVRPDVRKTGDDMFPRTTSPKMVRILYWTIHLARNRGKSSGYRSTVNTGYVIGSTNA